MTMDILFLCGSPCSGKSTLAELLEQRRGYAYFKADELLDPCMEEAAKAGSALCSRVRTLTPEQIWMRDPQLQCDEEFLLYEAMFPFFLEHLSAFAKQNPDKPLVAEGACFLPNMLADAGISPANCRCIVPTPAFQLEHYSQREWVKDFLRPCSDPEQAFQNWMQRDILFAQEALRRATAFGCQTFVNDGSIPIQEMANQLLP